MKVEQTQNQPVSAHPNSPARRAQNSGASSLSSGSTRPPGEKLQAQLTQAQNWLRETLLWLYDSILWIFQGCPPEEAPTDLLEEILKAPKELAVDCGKKPVPFLADLILSALLDPQGIQELRNQNKPSIGCFVREYKRKDRNWKSHLSPRRGFDLEKALYAGLYRNPSLLHKMLATLHSDLLKILGNSDKEGDTVQVKALRRICNGYLKKVLEKSADDPALLVLLHQGLLSKKPEDYIAVFQKVVTPRPSKVEAGDLLRVFENGALVLQQLKDPGRFLGKAYEGAPSLAFATYIHQSYLAHMGTKEYRALSDLIGEHFPLLKAVVQQVQALDEPARTTIVRQLPQALTVLRNLRDDLENPPR